MAGRLPIIATTTATAGGCLRHHPRLRTGGLRRLRPRLCRHPRQDAAVAGREEKCVSTPTAHRRRRFHRLALARLLAEAAEWRMSAEFAKKFLKRFGKRRENNRSQWEKRLKNVQHSLLFGKPQKMVEYVPINLEEA